LAPRVPEVLTCRYTEWPTDLDLHSCMVAYSSTLARNNLVAFWWLVVRSADESPLGLFIPLLDGVQASE
jgi:hypothetical protein